MRAALIALCLFAGNAHAYYGSFDPHLDRNSVNLTVIDSQLPNVECAARMHPLLAPLILTAVVGCFVPETDTLIAPISPGPMWVWVMGNALITPNQLLGHEFRHAFEYDFHPPFLSFIESSWLRDDHTTDGVVSSDKH